MLATAIVANLIMAARPTLTDVMQWFPPDTETIVAVTTPGSIAEYDKAGNLGEAMPYFGSVGLPGRPDYLQGLKFDFIVDGSRHFRPPAALGLMPYEGCKIVAISPIEQTRLMSRIHTEKAPESRV